MQVGDSRDAQKLFREIIPRRYFQHDEAGGLLIAKFVLRTFRRPGARLVFSGGNQQLAELGIDSRTHQALGNGTDCLIAIQKKTEG